MGAEHLSRAIGTSIKGIHLYHHNKYLATRDLSVAYQLMAQLSMVAYAQTPSVNPFTVESSFTISQE